jgi:hypothetical protein
VFGLTIFFSLCRLSVLTLYRRQCMRSRMLLYRKKMEENNVPICASFGSVTFDSSPAEFARDKVPRVDGY